jgi:hypothetical protein
LLAEPCSAERGAPRNIGFVFLLVLCAYLPLSQCPDDIRSIGLDKSLTDHYPAKPLDFLIAIRTIRRYSSLSPVAALVQ